MFKKTVMPCQKEACMPPVTEQVGGGTASVIRKYGGKTLLISAEHVCSHVGKISLAESVEVLMKGGNIEIQLRAVDIHGHSYKAKIVDLNIEKDICLLMVDSGIDVTPIRIATKPPKRGDSVFYFGCALAMCGPGTLPQWNGYFAGKAYEEDSTKKKNYRYLFTQSSVYPGASGSAILNNNGELISIAAALKIWNLYGHPQAAADMNFGCELEEIQKMVKDQDMLYMF